MAEKPNYVEELEAFRQLLVTERRSVISRVFEIRRHNDAANDDTEGVFRAVEVKALQEQIEAVDRAIKDEENLRPSHFEAMIG